MYRDLLLSLGGGIIPNSQRVDSNGCANIIIGLGGTGIDCLKEVKKQVYNRIKPDDNITSDIPIYQNIQFLAIDSDRNSINNETFAGIDPVNEYFDIGFSDIHSILNHSKILRQTPSLRWLSDKISIHDARAGAGGVRQVGRLLMMMKSDRIKETIIYKINSAMQGLAGAKLNIHIFTGMCGGTGSGIFLDICYIIGHIIEELALGGRATVAGYFFLPDVNIEKVHVDAVRKYMKINGYAAMKELDHCMNFDKNGGEWNQEYNNYRILSKHAPVDIAYLVSSIDIDGNIRTNGYKYAINVVADYVTESLIHPFCLYPVMPPAYYSQKKTGACYNYYALGGARAYVPYKDIYSYLAARVFEAYQTLPSMNHDTDAFISDNYLTYGDLLRKMNENADVVSLDTFIGFALPLIPSLSSKMSEELSRVKEVLQKNRLELERSVINHIKNKLIEIATCQGKGPVYASLFLCNLNRDSVDISDIIQGYIVKNNINYAQANENMKLRFRTMESTLGELQKAKLQKNRKARAYVSSAYSYFLEKTKIVLYKEMGDFLSQLKSQIRDLYDNFFAPVDVMLSNVAETFKNNYSVLTNSTAYDSCYAEKLVDLNDTTFRKSLDVELESIDKERVVNNFISYMISRTNDWLDHNSDSKIYKAVSEFFIQQFSGVVSQDIDYYLREKYQTVNQQRLINQIYQDVLVRLKDEAQPLFWADSSTDAIEEGNRIGYCLYPNNSATLNAAAILLKQADNQILIRSTTALLDSVSMFIVYFGIPMYLYRGVAYKESYKQHMMSGLHIYEWTDQDTRDFRKLHSVIPLSLYSDNELEDVKDFVNDYDRAVENEIIYKKFIGVPNRFEYQIRLVDDEVFLAKKQRIKTLIKNCSEASEETFKKCIEECEDFLRDDTNTKVNFKNHISIPNNGVSGYEDSVVRDHVFASEYYTSVFLKQLKKIDELDSMILRLQRIAHSKN